MKPNNKTLSDHFFGRLILVTYPSPIENCAAFADDDAGAPEKLKFLLLAVATADDGTLPDTESTELGPDPIETILP